VPISVKKVEFLLLGIMMVFGKLTDLRVYPAACLINYVSSLAQNLLFIPILVFKTRMV